MQIKNDHQLQHFFVTHRKCTPSEAIAKVGAVAAMIDERAKEEAGKEGKDAKTEDAEKDLAKAAAAQSAAKPGEAGKSSDKTVHVHLHTAGCI